MFQCQAITYKELPVNGYKFLTTLELFLKIDVVGFGYTIMRSVDMIAFCTIIVESRKP